MGNLGAGRLRLSAALRAALIIFASSGEMGVRSFFGGSLMRRSF